MKHAFVQSLIILSLAFPGLAATPPIANQQIVNPYYSADEYQLAHSMFDRIRADLDRAQTNAYPNNLGDAPRFDIAREQLGRLETHWDQARYDTSEFERTMTAIQMVLNDNRLTPHDSNELSADLSRLLEFRAEYY